MSGSESAAAPHRSAAAAPPQAPGAARSRTIPLPEVTVGVLALALFVFYFGIHCFRYPWTGDSGRHCAAVTSLYRDFLHPAHESMAVPGRESEEHTPYIVGVAAMGRSLGMTPYRALQLTGVLNLVFYVWAIWFFFWTSSIVRGWIAPVVFLLVSLFLRSRVFYWSSETGVASMRLIQAYPSFFAWGAALTVFGLVERYLRRPRTILLPAIAFLIWVLLLSHGLTGSWVVGIVGLRGAFELLDAKSSWRRALPLVAALLFGVVTTVLWPYFDITRSKVFFQIAENADFGRRPFRDMSSLYAVALLAAASLVLLKRHIFWVIAFAATWSTLLVFRFLGFDFGNRYVFFQAFFAQVAVAEVFGLALVLGLRQEQRVKERIEIGPRLQLGILLLAAFVVVLIAASPAARQERIRGSPLLGLADLMQLPPTEDAHYRKLGAVGERLGPADSVLMPIENTSWDVASITGARVVVSPVAYRVPDYVRRTQDVRRFFSPRVSAREKEEILRRYRVSKVLLTPAFFNRAEELTARWGPAIARTDSLLLFDIDQEHRLSRESQLSCRSGESPAVPGGAKALRDFGRKASFRAHPQESAQTMAASSAAMSAAPIARDECRKQEQHRGHK